MKLPRLFYKICIVIFFYTSSAKCLEAQQLVRPLDSMIQVLAILNIPEEIQEDWLEQLEKYEDNQDSPAFRKVLAQVKEDLDYYLVNGITKYEAQPKKKKKKFFKNIGDKVAEATKKVKRGVDISLPLELAKAAEKSDNYEMAFKNYKIAIREYEEKDKILKAIEWQEHVACCPTLHRIPPLWLQCPYFGRCVDCVHWDEK